MPPLIQTLGDRFPNVREAAARALDQLHEPLGRLIYDSLNGSREAQEELARRKDPRSLGPLIRILTDGDPWEREAAAWSLWAIGDPRALEPLILRLNDRIASVRHAAAWALHKIGDPRATDAVIMALGDPEPKVREAAAWAIEKISSPRATDALIKTMGDPEPKVREAAVWALSKIRDPRATGVMIEALDDSNPKVREAAVWSLERMAGLRSADPIMKALGDDDQKVRAAAAQVLERLGQPLGRLIYDSLQGSETAAAELAARKDPRSLDPLIRALENNDSKVRRAAAGVLGKINDPLALKGLIKMAGGWNLRNRLAATVALMQMDQGRFPALVPTFLRVIYRPASLIYLSVCLSLFGFTFYVIICRKKPS
jgi:HEAT repeat protein